MSKQTKLKDPQQINFIGKLENQDPCNNIFHHRKIRRNNFKSFTKFCHNHINNGNTKNCKFIKWQWQWKLKICNKIWYVINDESKGNDSPNNEIKFITKTLGSSLSDYSDAYILVTGNITVNGVNANTKATFKNCAPFIECRTKINETVAHKAKNISIVMPMYNLIEYSDNYCDTSGNLWQFKRDELNVNDINTALTNDNTLHLGVRPVLLVILVQMEENKA